MASEIEWINHKMKWMSKKFSWQNDKDQKQFAAHRSISYDSILWSLMPNDYVVFFSYLAEQNKKLRIKILTKSIINDTYGRLTNIGNFISVDNGQKKKIEKIKKTLSACRKNMAFEFSLAIFVSFLRLPLCCWILMMTRLICVWWCTNNVETNANFFLGKITTHIIIIIIISIMDNDQQHSKMIMIIMMTKWHY